MIQKANPKIAIAGSVNSSAQTLQKLYEYSANIVGVLGLHPDNAENVSGFCDIVKLGKDLGLPTQYFNKINDSEVYEWLKAKDIDLFFVVGLSQLVREPLFSLAKYGNVGFHPTKLPKGRGRGALAWIILGYAPGAATFFLMDQDMDSGPILTQKDFEVGENDYVSDLTSKIRDKIAEGLDDIIPSLKEGTLNVVEQDHPSATYLGKRKPKDGWINWKEDANSINRLVRASSPPLPGAFTYVGDDKLIIYKAIIEKDGKYIGVPGRIMEIEGQNNRRILIACGKKALWVTDYYYKGKKALKVGLDFY